VSAAKPRRIAILGGGMLGVCTALELARRGRPVTLIEGAPRVLDGASRWNEGKIHLGFLYAADPTLNTAARLIPGGLAFPDLVAQLVGRRLDEFATDDDVYLVHRDSVVVADAFSAYASRTADLVRDAASRPTAPRYLTDVDAAIHRLSTSELGDATASADVVAGFRVPERSVSTVAIADLLCQAVADEPRITVHVDTWVEGVRRRDDGRLDVLTNAAPADGLGGFDVVVNALWEGRPAVDATLGVMPPSPWSHRFRAGVFGRAADTTLRSAVLCTGPFGDIKRYRDGRLYLSWYAAGLLAEGSALEPPRGAAVMTPERRAGVMRATLDGLTTFFPGASELQRQAQELEVHGGWVYAIGQGSLADRTSTLHQRDKFKMTIDRGYISVDTAKYSLAPWLAARVAQIVVDA
jgi:glycine/D-amino acid oxidase-like deaminating enzyme